MAVSVGLKYDQSTQDRFRKFEHQQMHYRITPDHFTMLKTGRKANNYIVETAVFKAGKIWGKDKQNFALVGFGQRK